MKLASDATKFQVDGDPNFRISGVVQGKLIVDAADCARPDFLTNGSATASRWNPIYEFTHSGQQFEFFVRALASSIKYRIWVNGSPLTYSMQLISSTAGQRFRILVDFGSVAVRDIRFEMWEHEFAGVFVEPFGSICAAKYSRKKFAVISDSTGAGANGPIRMEAWPWHATSYLGVDYINLSIGGSGYISAPSFQSRLQDVIDSNPDYLFVAGGQNDKGGNTTAAIMDAFRLFCDSVTAALPNCKIIVGGVHMTTQNADAAGAPLEAALKAECLARGYPFVSQRDPQGIVDELPAWANGVDYKFGDQIQQNSLPFVCITEHTSSGSFNAANFRCSALFSGTGRVGATAGNGNLDICMTNDAVHFSAVGHELQGLAYAQQIADKF
jgi:lysophospholipase L1-like esterase